MEHPDLFSVDESDSLTNGGAERPQNNFHSGQNRWANVCVSSLPLLSHHHFTLPFPRPPLWLMCHSAQHNVLLSISWQSIPGAANSALWPLQCSILMETCSVMADAAWIEGSSLTVNVAPIILSSPEHLTVLFLWKEQFVPTSQGPLV